MPANLRLTNLSFIGDRHAELPKEMTLVQAEDALFEIDMSNSHTLQAAVDACEAGVKRVHLLDREQDDALLQELFSRDGAGILISASAFETTRLATIDDVGGILELIQPLEEAGVLVKRNREQLELHIENLCCYGA